MTIEKQEFLTRCAARYKDCAGVDNDTAQWLAESCWDEEVANGRGLGPEEYADMNMTYWTVDGEGQ